MSVKSINTHKTLSVLHAVDTGHEDMIHGAEMDYFGIRLATCSSDGSIKVFDTRNGPALIADLKGHTGPVWQISWAHPTFGTILASCSYDRKVIVWKDNGKWEKCYIYDNHESSVNSVQWAPSKFGMTLACGSSDGSISILTFETTTLKCEAKRILNAHIVGCNAVSWWPANNLESLDEFRKEEVGHEVCRLATGGCDNLVKIWRSDGDNWVEEVRLDYHSDWVNDVAWVDKAGGESVIASCSQDHRVVIWATEDYVVWTPTVLHVFDHAVLSVSWSLIGNVLAVSCSNLEITLWKEDCSAKGKRWLCISSLE